MKSWAPALLVVMPFVGVGCSYAQNVRRNVVFSPLYACTDRASHHRHKQLAREAWRQMASAYTDCEFSCDYRLGFVEGFADFLDNGGVGEPPPVAPPCYRLFGYMTPDGLAAMEDWKVGFRHGAATAKASGLRELVVIPVYWGPVYPTVQANEPKKEEPEPDKNEVLPPPTKIDKLESETPKATVPGDKPPEADRPPPEAPKPN